MIKKISIVAASILVLAGCGSSTPKPSHEESHSESHHEKHWNYSENGPTHWGEFSQTCSAGNAQSPINIIPGKTVEIDQKNDLSVDEDYKGMADIIDNGHSIKITPHTQGTLTLHGEKFNLLQFHFHGKSEHTIDGKRYDMVAHFVHQNAKTKQLAVFAVFFKEGAANPALDNVINNIGKKDVEIDPEDFMPKDVTHYYHYVGSLTTPPCSENVEWYLIKNTVTASKEQIDAFRKYYVDNERPVQELNNRVIESK